MSPTAQQAMAALEQAWLSWQPDNPTPAEVALRDVLTAWVNGGRKR